MVFIINRLIKCNNRQRFNIKHLIIINFKHCQALICVPLLTSLLNLSETMWIDGNTSKSEDFMYCKYDIEGLSDDKIIFLKYSSLPMTENTSETIPCQKKTERH